jgi:hypothetical protein
VRAGPVAFELLRSLSRNRISTVSFWYRFAQLDGCDGLAGCGNFGPEPSTVCAANFLATPAPVPTASLRVRPTISKNARSARNGLVCAISPRSPIHDGSEIEVLEGPEPPPREGPVH